MLAVSQHIRSGVTLALYLGILLIVNMMWLLGNRRLLETAHTILYLMADYALTEREKEKKKLTNYPADKVGTN